jgi:hypothetical protein
MPIKPIHLQRRHAELGRIRLGDQVTASNGKSRPNKLERFRFTSASETYVRDLAALYGGEPRAWDNNGKAEWEVYSEAQSIPVIAVKGGLSQWMETWSGGGCVHRCDGDQQVDGTPCDPEDPNHVNAKPTTRLSVMLPELEAIGVWRMESHGWNSAAEIPAVAELAQFVGDLVPAHLHLMERRAVKDGKTSRFVVPVLDLHIGAQRLREIVAEKSGQPLELVGGDQPALEQGQRAALNAPAPDYLAQAQAANSLEEIQGIWRTAHAAGHLTEQLAAELKIIGDSLAAAASPPTTPPATAQPDADGAYEAEVVDDGDADTIWQQILVATGQQGMSLTDTQEAYATFSGGVPAATATAAELQAFLVHLTGQPVSA